MQDTISRLLKTALQQALLDEYPARTYDGLPKPRSNAYPQGSSQKYVTGELYNSIEVYFEKTFEDGEPALVVDFGAADYWYYVQYGRKPGNEITKTRTTSRGNLVSYTSYTKYPPLSAIDKWLVRKPELSGLVRDESGRFISRKSLTFLMARGIARDGIAPTDFINKALDNVREELYQLLGEEMVVYFDNLINRGIVAKYSDK